MTDNRLCRLQFKLCNISLQRNCSVKRKKPRHSVLLEFFFFNLCGAFLHVRLLVSDWLKILENQQKSYSAKVLKTPANYTGVLTEIIESKMII